MTLCICD